MNVFLISNMYPTRQMPGFGVFVKNVVEGLERNGIQISHRALIKGKANNILRKIIKYFVFYITILVNYFGKYDVIYVHYPNMALPILYPLFCCYKKKVVVNLHGEDLFYSGFWGTILGQLNEKFIRKVDLVIVPSNFFLAELLKRNVCTEDKIFVSPSGGVDCGQFCYKADIRKKEMFSLGFVGRIDPNKGWKEYIEALSLLKSRLIFKAYVIGYGSQENDLLKLITSYGLDEVIEFVRGVKQDELAYYYNCFDILVFSTQLPESLGLVGLEAMACGVPVVGTNIGGVATYLNETNGFLVPKGDIPAISNAIMTFYNLDEESKLNLKQGALSTAHQYDRCVVIKKLYEKLISLVDE